MEFRIVEQDRLFYTEYLKVGLFKDKWLPFVTWSGLDKAYGFSSLINAENALLMEVKKYHIKIYREVKI